MIKNFAGTFLRVLTIAIGAMLVFTGMVAAFSSFFFEQTRSQMTWAIAGEHLAVFIVALLGITLGIRLLRWAFKI